jgi:hypothetical protein
MLSRTKVVLNVLNDASIGTLYLKRTISKDNKYLLADSDVSLTDQNAGVMNGLGESKLEDLKKKL